MGAEKRASIRCGRGPRSGSRPADFPSRIRGFAATLNAPFLILETGQPVASMRRHGRFPHWIRVAAGPDARRGGRGRTSKAAMRCRPRDGFAGVHRSPAPARWSPSVATGASAAPSGCATPRTPALPLFGICYGHQLLAHALGGEVGYNPAGREMGTVDLELHPHAADDPLFAGLPHAVPGAGHAPADACCARPTARRCWRARRRTPAMPSAGAIASGACSSIRNSAPRTCAATCGRKHEALAREGRCAQAPVAHVSATPHARRVLRRFVRHARQLHGSARQILIPGPSPRTSPAPRTESRCKSASSPCPGPGLVPRSHRSGRAQSAGRVRRGAVVHRGAVRAGAVLVPGRRRR